MKHKAFVVQTRVKKQKSPVNREEKQRLRDLDNNVPKAA
jgi:hypothetical protein